MAEPLVVIIPHNLGKAEATDRLRSGLAGIRSSFAGKLSVIEEAWTQEHLDFRVGLLGQEAKGTIDVGDQNVRLSVELPWFLAKLALKAKALIERQGQLMLERK
jgi:Putative polyhydroxyalkanoic acid system protein (PHA_gran_rgn)